MPQWLSASRSPAPAQHRLDDSDDTGDDLMADSGHIQGEIHLAVPHDIAPPGDSMRSLPPPEVYAELIAATEPSVIVYLAHEPDAWHSRYYTGEGTWLALNRGDDTPSERPLRN